MDKASYVLIALILTLFFNLAPIILVIKFWKEDIIRKRSPSLMITAIISGTILQIILILLLNILHEYSPLCIFNVITIYLFGPLCPFLLYTRGLALIYENSRIRAYMSTEKVNFNFVERLSISYFGFFQKRAKQVSKRYSTSSINPNQSTGLFSGRLSDKVLMLSLLPFIIACIVTMAIPFAMFYSSLFLSECYDFKIYGAVIIFVIFSISVVPVLLYSIFMVKAGVDIRNEILLTILPIGVLFVLYAGEFFIKTVIPPVLGHGVFGILVCHVFHFGSIMVPIYKEIGRAHV